MTETAAKAVDMRTAAAMYGVSYNTIRRAIAAGQLRAKGIGRSPRVDVGELKAWFDNLPDA